MNAKLLTILVAAALALPVAYAAHGDDGFGDWGENGQKFGDCPSGGWSCDQAPSGDPFPPDAVTGHTVYASFIMERDRVRDDFQNNTLGLPTDFAAIAGYFSFEDRFREREEIARAVQRECVVWFNGMNLEQRPDDDNFGPDNSFPSDEDEDPPSDQSYQDYDFDRDVHNCEPEFDSDFIERGNFSAGHGDFAVAVEKGDCNPGGPTAGDFRFRGHLDFVDPNGIYHEVQEYDYVCRTSVNVTAFGINTGEIPPEDLSPNRIAAGTVESFFPWTYSDEHNEEGCTIHETPGPADAGGNTDLGNGEAGFFDLGHKCNGSVQDLFKERLWITPIHDEVFDPTIERLYNFALQIDTCAGINIYEIDGKEAMGEDNDFANSEHLPGGVGTTALELYHEAAYHTYYSTGLDEFTNTGWPLFDVCTDGSSFSFNDTPRGRQVHSGPPAGTGDEEIMRGNSYDFDANSDTFGKHRTNCRVQDIDWPMNTYPPGPPAMGDDCYPEDHKTAEVDLYVYDFDPTGLWDVHTNGGTSFGGLDDPDVYNGPGTSTGPDGEPDA